MSDVKHEGWSNCETWNLHLYLQTHSGYTHEWALKQALYMLSDEEHWGIECLVKELAAEFESTFECPRIDEPYRTLLTNSLESVNWEEIAEEWLEIAKRYNEVT